MNDNKRIAVNSIIIFLRLCTVSAVSIIASRVVLDALGASDFGLYNVVGGIMLLINVVNMAMASSTYRYIAAEMGRGDKGNLNKIFNISLSNHAIFAGVIVMLGLTLGELYMFFGLNVAPEKFHDALIIYHISIFSSFLTTMLVPYRGLLVAYERFSVIAAIEVIAVLLRLVALLTLLYIMPNRLICYACIMVCTVLMECVFYLLYSRMKMRAVVKLQRYHDRQLNREMLSFSGWNSLGAFTNVAYTQVTAILINFFFGTIVNAAFAVANQINNFITTFANSLNQASVPQITKSFSAGNQERSLALTARVSKYTFFLMLLVAFPVLMELDFLLGLWLKEVPLGANIYCGLICLQGLLVCISQGTGSLVSATGKIKYFQIVSTILTVFTLLAGWLSFFLGANAYALSIVICVSRFVGVIVNVVLLKRIINFDVRLFVDVAYKRMVYVALPLAVLFVIYDSSSMGIAGHLIGLAVSGIIALVVIWAVGMDTVERAMISNRIMTIVKKRK